jgi:purine-binding chemotaxis protein CheW
MRDAAEPRTDAGDTLSICSLRVGAALFGIDTSQIREVLGTACPQRVPLAPEYIAGVLPYRGEVLTTVCFRALLGLECWAGGNCVLVFDDEENEERFGLMVDGVGGVIAVHRDALEANPGGLDARSQELFDGAYKLPSGLMVRLDPQRLRPSRLAASGLFGNESGLFGGVSGSHGRVKQERQGEQG